MIWSILPELIRSHGNVDWALPFLAFRKFDGFPEINFALIKFYWFSTSGTHRPICSSLGTLILFELFNKFIEITRRRATISSLDKNLEVLLLHELYITGFAHIELSLWWFVLKTPWKSLLQSRIMLCLLRIIISLSCLELITRRYCLVWVDTRACGLHSWRK